MRFEVGCRVDLECSVDFQFPFRTTGDFEFSIAMAISLECSFLVLDQVQGWLSCRSGVLRQDSRRFRVAPSGQPVILNSPSGRLFLSSAPFFFYTRFEVGCRVDLEYSVPTVVDLRFLFLFLGTVLGTVILVVSYRYDIATSRT